MNTLRVAIRSSLIGFLILCASAGTEAQPIIGGIAALIEEAPWTVCLIAGFPDCGGTILSKDWILTAAHCVDAPGAESGRELLMP